MKRTIVASVIALLAAAPAMANPLPPTPSWFILDPRTSTCSSSQSPREENAYIRTLNIIPDTKVYRHPDGSLQGVALTFTMNGESRELDYWPTMAACLDFRDYLAKKGELLPPDIQ